MFTNTQTPYKYIYNYIFLFTNADTETETEADPFKSSDKFTYTFIDNSTPEVNMLVEEYLHMSTAMCLCERESASIPVYVLSGGIFHILRVPFVPLFRHHKFSLDHLANWHIQERKKKWKERMKKLHSKKKKRKLFSFQKRKFHLTQDLIL